MLEKFSASDFFFLSEIFFARSAVGGQTGGEAPSKASEASLEPIKELLSVGTDFSNWNRRNFACMRFLYFLRTLSAKKDV